MITRQEKLLVDKSNIAEGDLVLIVSGPARAQCVRGFVEEVVVHGRGRRVHQAIVRTASRVLRRSTEASAARHVRKWRTCRRSRWEPEAGEAVTTRLWPVDAMVTVLGHHASASLVSSPIFCNTSAPASRSSIGSIVSACKFSCSP